MLDKILNDAVIKTALNKALALDPQAAEKLAVLEGKKIAIKLNLREEPWVFLIVNQQLEIGSVDMQDCDVKLSGSLSGFLQLFNQSSSSVNVNDKLYIEGDLHAAQQFQRVMAQLSPDFEYSLKKYFGTTLGGVLNEGLEQVKNLGDKAQHSLQNKLRDFFIDQENGCLTHTEFQQYKSRLSNLRLTLDRLEAKVSTLR